MKETRRYTISASNIIRELGYRGTRDITGKNFMDEPSHNAKDANASQQGFFFSEDEIIFGNDGDFLDWSIHKEKGINYAVPKHNSNSTSYWGVGSTKYTSYCDGVPNYTCHSKDGNYFIRRWEFENRPKVLTTENVSYLGSCEFVEYELDEEEYKKHTHCTKFGFLPTHFVSLQRFKDSSKKYDSKKMIESLDFAFMITDNFKSFCVVNDGNKISTTKKYYPTVIQKGQHYVPTSNLTELNRVREHIKIKEGIFDVYLLEVIDNTKHIQKWLDLKNSTNEGKDIIKLKGRGKNPRHIWINHRNVQLICEDVHPQIKHKERDKAYDTVLLLHQVGGKFEFPTIKTSGIDDESREIAVNIHMEEVLNNKNIQYNPKKAEDSKVDQLVNWLITDENNTMRNGMAFSIQHMTEDTLNISDVTNLDNFSVRETHDDGREYDLLISKTGEDNYTFHGEYQNGIEDFEHIDQITSKILSKQAYYNVLITDKLSTKKKKRKFFRDIMNDNNIQAYVYLCTFEQFTMGDTSNFELIRRPNDITKSTIERGL